MTRILGTARATRPVLAKLDLRRSAVVLLGTYEVTTFTTTEGAKQGIQRVALPGPGFRYYARRRA